MPKLNKTLTFNVYKEEVETFQRIKKELCFKNDEQVLRRLMYMYDDLKHRNKDVFRWSITPP